MKSPQRILLIGAAGRMGQAVIGAAERQPAIVIAATCNRGERIDQRINDCDVVVDFSNADATQEICIACTRASKPLVTGTTGHSAAAKALIEEAARVIPIVAAPNFSIGINMLSLLARHAGDLLGESFDVEIVEAHHREKKDAPSGTAKRLAQILGGRKTVEVAIHSIRGGDIVGDHTIIFAGAGERIELTHRASSRETFAIGALRAASWVVDRPAGLYAMEDVLGLSRQ